MSGKFIRRKGFSSAEKCIAAFTLVELLVVVAIIALLVSILLPSLGRAKEQAKVAVCKMNLKGLGNAFTLYATEAEDHYPAGAGFGGDPPIWDARMLEFYSSKGMVHCPSDNASREDWYNRRGCSDDRRFPRSYSINLEISYRGDSEYGYEYPEGVSGQQGSNPYNGKTDMYPWPGDGVSKTSEIVGPSDTIILGEQWEHPYYGHLDDINPSSYNQYPAAYIVYDGYSLVTFSHSDNTRANFLFCDGHSDTLLENDQGLIDINGNGADDPEDYYLYKKKQ